MRSLVIENSMVAVCQMAVQIFTSFRRSSTGMLITSRVFHVIIDVSKIFRRSFVVVVVAYQLALYCTVLQERVLVE